jgi:hypothetical protein
MASRVETRRFQAMGQLDVFNLYSPPTVFRSFGRRILRPRAALVQQILQNRDVTAGCGVRKGLAPLATALAKPLQHLQMCAAVRGVFHGGGVPGAALLHAQVLEHVQVSVRSRLGHHRFIHGTLVGDGPFQRIQLSVVRGVVRGPDVPRAPLLAKKPKHLRVSTRRGKRRRALSPRTSLGVSPFDDVKRAAVRSPPKSQLVPRTRVVLRPSQGRHGANEVRDVEE